MRIDLRDDARRRIGRITVDPALRPTRVAVQGREREVFLQWDTALDDAGQLRRCVACGCPDLFRERARQWLLVIVIVLAFGGAAIGVLGFARTTEQIAGLVALLLVDLVLLAATGRRVVCYRCLTTYTGLPIARYLRGWDRGVADRQPRTAPPPVPARPDAS